MFQGNNVARVQRAITCGFNAGTGRIVRRRENCRTEVVSKSAHVYPLDCPPPQIITVDRVTQISGVN